MLRLAVAFCLVALSVASPKINVQLYFETFCPGCSQFITTDLNETVNSPGMADILNVDLIPFGNARVMMGKVLCQHGTDECTGMKWEGCAITKYPEFTKHFPYILCVEKDMREGLKIVETCAKDQGDEFYATVSQCVAKEGDHVLKAMGQLTGKHKYVPWPLVNGKLLEENEKLIDVICKIATEPKPAACQDRNLLTKATSGNSTCCPNN